MQYRNDINKPDRPEKLGVTSFTPDRCYPGYTLCYSRNGESAFLVAMDGEIVHRWTYRQDIAWHFAEMLPNGHLLAIANKGAQNLLELDWNSRIVRKFPIRAHHDAKRLANGNTLVICHGRALYEHICDRPLLYDYLLELDPNGKIIWEWHYAPHSGEVPGTPAPPSSIETDWPHLNTIQLLPENPIGVQDPRFRAGNLLISPRHMHRIWIVDRDSGEIVWDWGLDVIFGQHQPTMLSNGNILLFDNGRGPTLRGYSRVLEITPPEGRIVCSYQADPLDSFWSPVGSGAQRLPNGNTLICQMNWQQTGRAFEVTQCGDIVWDFWNPEDDMMYRAVRYGCEAVDPLL